MLTGPYNKGLGQIQTSSSLSTKHPTLQHNIICTYKGSVTNTLLITCAMLWLPAENSAVNGTWKTFPKS